VLPRKVTTTNPPQVTYSLNAEGKKLVPLMETLGDRGSADFGIKPIVPAQRVLDSFLKNGHYFLFSRCKIIRSNAIGNSSRGEYGPGV
jgi:hypothetical protein